MQPTFNPVGEAGSAAHRDWVLVDKWSVKVRHAYKQGDVVVLW